MLIFVEILQEILWIGASWTCRFGIDLHLLKNESGSSSTVTCRSCFFLNLFIGWG